MSETATIATNHRDSSMEIAVRVKNAKLRDIVTGLRAERDAAIAERDRTKAELTDVKSKTDTSAIHKRNQELEGKLRTIEHRKVLDAAAIAKGIKPEALDAFYELSKYEAKGEPNEEEIGAFVDSHVEKFGFLVGKEEPATTEEQPRKTAPGSGKSKPGATTTTGFQKPSSTDPIWSDHKWVNRHWDDIVKADQEAEAKGVLLE